MISFAAAFSGHKIWSAKKWFFVGNALCSTVQWSLAQMHHTNQYLGHPSSIKPAMRCVANLCYHKKISPIKSVVPEIWQRKTMPIYQISAWLLRVNVAVLHTAETEMVPLSRSLLYQILCLSNVHSNMSVLQCIPKLTFSIYLVPFSKSHLFLCVTL